MPPAALALLWNRGSIPLRRMPNTTPGAAAPNYQLSIFKIVLPCIWHLAGGQKTIETNWKSNGYKIRPWIWVEFLLHFSNKKHKKLNGTEMISKFCVSKKIHFISAKMLFCLCLHLNFRISTIFIYTDIDAVGRNTCIPLRFLKQRYHEV